jgi:hypothetical protein
MSAMRRRVALKPGPAMFFPQPSPGEKLRADGEFGFD